MHQPPESPEPRRGRPPSITFRGAQQLNTKHCPPELKLQLIQECDELGLTLSMYIAMVLYGVGRDVRKAAAMECAIELEEKRETELLSQVTPKQIRAFEIELLESAKKADEEAAEEKRIRDEKEAQMKRIRDMARAEAEEIIARVSKNG